MVSMRFDKGLTLAEIGKIYSLTRERVRQIVGNSGHILRVNWTKRKLREIDLRKITRDDLKNITGIKYVIKKAFSETHHKVKKGDTGVFYGEMAEEYVRNLLCELGVQNRLMPYGHPFDILTDCGKRIDVKSASKKIKPPSQKAHPYYNISINKKKRGNYADFFVIVIEMRTVYIIPSKDLSENFGFIRIFYPPNLAKTSKWTQYINRFDLLK
jgi:hypothetical protein